VSRSIYILWWKLYSLSKSTPLFAIYRPLRVFIISNMLNPKPQPWVSTKQLGPDLTNIGLHLIQIACQSLRASPTQCLVSMWPCKNISYIQVLVLYLFFYNHTHKTETETANMWGPLMANHLDQSWSIMEWASSYPFICWVSHLGETSRHTQHSGQPWAYSIRLTLVCGKWSRHVNHDILLE
jgi:hypothetical protein